MKLVAIAALMLANAAAAGAADPAPVVEAERAFAAEVGRSGFKRGFLAYAAPDGFMFQPGPVNARTLLEKAPDQAPPGPPLNWWPLWAGMATSGDLGFTTGGATVPVRYFTVWQKQSDGSWKWIYDGGPPVKGGLGGTPDSPVSYLKPATAAAGSAAKALAEIAPLEADLAATAASDIKAAHLEYLAEDGLAAWSPTRTEPGRDGQMADLDLRPAQAVLTSKGAVASKAGDLAFTYGEARWVKADKPGWGHYARIWQKRVEGWRLVSDILVPAPGAPPQRESD